MLYHLYYIQVVVDSYASFFVTQKTKQTSVRGTLVKKIPPPLTNTEIFFLLHLAEAARAAKALSHAPPPSRSPCPSACLRPSPCPSSSCALTSSSGSTSPCCQLSSRCTLWGDLHIEAKWWVMISFE